MTKERPLKDQAGRIAKLVKHFLRCIEACDGLPVPPHVAPFVLCPMGASGDDVEVVLVTVIEGNLVDIAKDDDDRSYLLLNPRGHLALQEIQGLEH